MTGQSIDMILQVFSIVAPVFIVVGVGYFYGARVRPEMTITNQLNMDVFIPALILSVLIKENFSPLEYTSIMIGGTAVILFSGLAAFALARLLGYQWRTFVPPAMFSNWANLGLPLYLFAFGQDAVDAGVMLVIIGNFFSFTLGVYIFSGGLNWLSLVKTPVLIAVLLGVLISGFGLTVPNIVERPISMMGQVAIPLMLFSLGVRLSHVSWTDTPMGLIMAVFCPLIGVTIALLMVKVLPLSPLHADVLILFGALPPAIINFILAERYSEQPEKVASMVMIGNLTSMVSIPIVLYFLLLN